MTENGLLRAGIIGTVVSVVLLHARARCAPWAVGLAAAIGWLDYVLLPALVLFLGLTAFALWKRRSA